MQKIRKSKDSIQLSKDKSDVQDQIVCITPKYHWPKKHKEKHLPSSFHPDEAYIVGSEGML